MDPKTRQAIQLMWEYMQLHQPVQPAEALILLGSRDDRVATYAAQLLLKHVAPICVVSGGIVQQRGLASAVWTEKTEAERFSRALIAEGVDPSIIYVEDTATNTGDNAIRSYEVLARRHIHPKSILIATKPYMERRALATFEMQWPDKKTIMHVSSAACIIDDYCNDDQPWDTVLNTMVGDFARIVAYAKRELATEQPVPQNVREAFETLVDAGYDKRVVNI